MRPGEALREQIARNERAITGIENGDVDKKLNGKLADEGRVYIVRELKSINDGLKKALETIEPEASHASG